MEFKDLDLVYNAKRNTMAKKPKNLIKKQKR